MICGSAFVTKVSVDLCIHCSAFVRIHVVYKSQAFVQQLNYFISGLRKSLVEWVSRSKVYFASNSSNVIVPTDAVGNAVTPNFERSTVKLCIWVCCVHVLHATVFHVAREQSTPEVCV